MGSLTQLDKINSVSGVYQAGKTRALTFPNNIQRGVSQPRRNIDNFVVRFSHNLVQPGRKLWGEVNTDRCLCPPSGITTHLCSPPPENQKELTQLSWAKSGVNKPFLPMMIRAWITPSVDHESVVR